MDRNHVLHTPELLWGTDDSSDWTSASADKVYGLQNWTPFHNYLVG